MIPRFQSRNLTVSGSFEKAFRSWLIEKTFPSCLEDFSLILDEGFRLTFCDDPDQPPSHRLSRHSGLLRPEMDPGRGDNPMVVVIPWWW
jgi:hypothetical protein